MSTELRVQATDVLPGAYPQLLMIRRYSGHRFSVFTEYLLETGEPSGRFEMLTVTPAQRAAVSDYLARLDTAVADGVHDSLMSGAL